MQGHRARFVNRMKAQVLLNSLCDKSGGRSRFDGDVAIAAKQLQLVDANSGFKDNFAAITE